MIPGPQRTLQFLPFFVLGLLARPEHFRFVQHRAVRLLSLPLFGAALLSAYWARHGGPGP